MPTSDTPVEPSSAEWTAAPDISVDMTPDVSFVPDEPLESPVQTQAPPSADSHTDNVSTPPSDVAPSPPPAELSVSETLAPAVTVTVWIEGPDGWLIENAEVEFSEGFTAADAIVTACEMADVELITRGSGKYVYIVSIGGYAEKSLGALSGWIFKLNGVQSSVGAGAAVLSADDRVSVYFSLDMGGDASDKD